MNSPPENPPYKPAANPSQGIEDAQPREIPSKTDKWQATQEATAQPAISDGRQAQAHSTAGERSQAPPGKARVEPKQNEPKSRQAQIDEMGRDFSPSYMRLQKQLPNPLPRLLMWLVTLMCVLLFTWAWIGKLDIVAVADGKLISKEYLKLVQPGDTGFLRDLLVREGQTVEEGQILFRFDPQIAKADERSVENELAQRELQLNRIEAELRGAPLKALPQIQPEYLLQAAGQLEVNRRAYLDAIATEQASLEKARSELRAANEVLSKLQKTEPIFRSAYTRANSLVDEGFVTRQFAEDRHKEYIERQQDMVTQQYTVKSLTAAVEQSEKKLAQINSGYRQSLTNERAQAEMARNKLTEDLAKQRYKGSMIEIRAPRRGIVKDLATHTQGSFIQAGSQLLSIVPTDELLEAEVLIKNEDVAFVKLGQRVQLKLAAYPYTRYGMLEGKVVRISPDASDVNANESGRQKPDGKFEITSTYRARIALENQYLEHNGEKLSVLPGLLVSAEINLGKRSVLQFLLSPIASAVREAGRER